MKTLYTFLIFSACFSFQSLGQFEAYVLGDLSGTDYSGDTYTYQALDTLEQPIYVNFVNKTGMDSLFVVSRQRLSPVATSWQDGLCWEGDSGFGICITADNMDQDYYQITPGNGAFVAPDGSVELKSQIKPHFNDPGTYTYRYYVGTPTNPAIDSIDIEMTLTPLSIPEPTLTVGIQPNPASEHITINAEGFATADVQIVDVLGNVVLNTQLSGTKTIDVAEYRNGIYFVTVSASGTRVSRKVIVRH